MTVDELPPRWSARGADPDGPVRSRRRPVLAGRGDHRRLGGQWRGRRRRRRVRRLRRWDLHRWRIHHRSRGGPISDRCAARRDRRRRRLHRRRVFGPRRTERRHARRQRSRLGARRLCDRRRPLPGGAVARGGLVGVSRRHDRASSGRCPRTADSPQIPFPVGGVPQPRRRCRRPRSRRRARNPASAPDPVDTSPSAVSKRVRRWPSLPPRAA